jgi:hypothetical protein
METTNKPTDGAGTIPGRRSDGIAGPSREVSQRDGYASLPDENGQENSELTWAKRHIRDPVTVERKTELAGCGLPHRKKKIPPAEERRESLATVLPPEVLENHGDLLFFLFDRMDRTTARQDRKIERISRRVAELEERGRSG